MKLEVLNLKKNFGNKEVLKTLILLLKQVKFMAY